MKDPEGLIVKDAEPYPLLTSAKDIRLGLELVKKNPTNFSNQISITYYYVVLEFDKNILVIIRKNGFVMTMMLRNGKMHSLQLIPSSTGAFLKDVMQISLGVLCIIANSFFQDSSFMAFSNNLRSFTLKGLVLLPLKAMTEPLLILRLKSKNSKRMVYSQHQLVWLSPKNLRR